MDTVIEGRTQYQLLLDCAIKSVERNSRSRSVTPNPTQSQAASKTINTQEVDSLTADPQIRTLKAKAYRSGDFVYYHHQQIARLNQLFVHELNPIRRAFAVISKVQDTALKDPVLNLPLLRFTVNDQGLNMIGLPAIDFNKLYILPVSERDEEPGQLRLGGDETLIQYL